MVSRSAWLGACSDTASVALSPEAASLAMALGTPVQGGPVAAGECFQSGMLCWKRALGAGGQHVG